MNKNTKRARAVGLSNDTVKNVTNKNGSGSVITRSAENVFSGAPCLTERRPGKKKYVAPKVNDSCVLQNHKRRWIVLDKNGPHWTGTYA